jgi:hypothetical protein
LERYLPSPHTVVFCAIDDFLPISGTPLAGFPDFLDSLAHHAISCVWLTTRNRHQLDPLLRRLAHNHPFIAEGGSCIYIPEDYFHLKPQHTTRLGRFIAIPVAKRQPAAAEALELLSEQTAITVVPLRSLSLRELMQNTGLPRTEAESVRQRDFDELFFFAGASDRDIRRFHQHATHLKFSVRSQGTLWSLAINPSVPTCVRQLRNLYDRAFHRPAFSIALATSADARELCPACDRAILFAHSADSATALAKSASRPLPTTLPLFQANSWEQAAHIIQTRQFSSGLRKEHRQNLAAH